ncbi:MAG TPA: PEPxxWA-CTERM sorting domain-containing protein [Allosphingosinicella sp.]
MPEPTSWALMIAGFGLAGAALRRRTLRVAYA